MPPKPIAAPTFNALHHEWLEQVHAKWSDKEKAAFVQFNQIMRMALPKLGLNTTDAGIGLALTILAGMEDGCKEVGVEPLVKLTQPQ